VNLKLLEDIVGDDYFKTICNVMAGENLYIPGHGYSSKLERNNAIRKDFYHGIDCVNLANKYNLSISQVYKIVEEKG
jgi:Mor family transcriptional regulator